ncbi:immunity protein TriTu family protein [Rugamonas rivuli]|uniref:Uncharacterized protein n=1 Tax=Rugamonas rivuli TaxID=2743358 RepID=A0A843SPN2_9BURK|nr:hypothetical protein [Rugamonas rivuli]MQA22817.1 hypothetical protein [Rugamonas rivuli]
MLNTFYDLAKEIMGRLPAGIQAELTIAPNSDNPSARIDFDTRERLGRITCWDSGDFYAEIIDVESGDDLYEQRGEAASAARLSALLQSFLSSLAAPLS